jgi:hypothetical protein
MLAVLVALILSIATAWILKPDATRFWLAIALALVTENTRPPPIARGVITRDDWRDRRSAERKLTAVLEKKFPVGTSEDVLKSALLKEGFKFLGPPHPECVQPGQRPTGRIFALCYDPTKILDYYWISIGCSETVQVKWEVDDQRNIMRVEGIYGSVCL